MGVKMGYKDLQKSAEDAKATYLGIFAFAPASDPEYRAARKKYEHIIRRIYNTTHIRYESPMTSYHLPPEEVRAKFDAAHEIIKQREGR